MPSIYLENTMIRTVTKGRRPWMAAVVAGGVLTVFGCAKPPPAETASSVDDNLLGNAGFETGDASFAPWVMNIHADPEAYEFALDETVAKDGKFSVRVRKVRDEPFASAVQHFRKRQLDQARYRLSVWLRGENLDSPTYLHAAFSRFGGQFALIDNRDKGLSGTFNWTRLEMEIVMPPEFDSAEIGISTTGNGVVWIDAAELVPLNE